MSSRRRCVNTSNAATGAYSMPGSHTYYLVIDGLATSGTTFDMDITCL